MKPKVDPGHCSLSFCPGIIFNTFTVGGYFYQGTECDGPFTPGVTLHRETSRTCWRTGDRGSRLSRCAPITATQSAHSSFTNHFYHSYVFHVFTVFLSCTCKCVLSRQALRLFMHLPFEGARCSFGKEIQTLESNIYNMYKVMIVRNVFI